MSETNDRGAQSNEPSGPSSRRWLLAAAAVLALGVAAYVGIGALVPDAEPRRQPASGPLIDVVSAQRAQRLSISQTGFVVPVAQLALSAEVTGRVSAIDAAFRIGRRVAAGTELVSLATGRFEAELQAARARLDGAQARRDTARTERQRQRTLEDRGFTADARVEEATTLLAEAEAQVGLAGSQLALAQIALDDSRLVAPYDALVSERTVSLGQIVQPGVTVGTLVRADAVEIRIGLLPRQRELAGEVDTLLDRTVQLFRVNAAAREQAIATGRIDAIDPVIDPGTRTLGLVIRVAAPFDGPAPLRVGELLEVVVPLDNGAIQALRIPSQALKGNDRLWRVSDEGTLQSVRPTILRRDDDTVWVSTDGLSADDRLMTTDIASAVDGLGVRLADEQAAR